MHYGILLLGQSVQPSWVQLGSRLHPHLCSLFPCPVQAVSTECLETRPCLWPGALAVSPAPSLSEFATVTPHCFPPVEAAPLDILCFAFSSLTTAPYDSTVFSSYDLSIGNMAEGVKWIDSVVSLLGVNQLWHWPPTFVTFGNFLILFGAHFCHR